MNRQVTEQEALDLINNVQTLMNKIEKIATKYVRKYKDNIIHCANQIKEQKIIEELKKIPVEEVNKDKLGIRTKCLRDANYKNLADLYNAYESDIAEVKGIGDNIAKTIKTITLEIAKKVRAEAKIKLSLDNKNRETTQLVINISRYKNCIKYVDECEKFIYENGKMIYDLIDDIKPLTGEMKYVFAVQINKAVEAYSQLSAIYNPSFVLQFKQLFDIIDQIACTNGAYAWDDFAKNAAEFNGILQDLLPELVENDDSIYGLPEELAQEIQNYELDLTGVNCKLRKYQELGVKYILHQERVLLGDEMGLGKTVQAIAAMVSLRNKGATHFLVVCPAGVLINWCREIKLHSNLNVIKLHGNNRKKYYNDWLENGGVAVTTYESLSDFMFSNKFKFSLLVVDEAHYVKNPEAKRTQKVEKIGENAEKILFMTGTALENKVSEMIEIIAMLRPDIAKEAYDIAFMHTAHQFREKISPVYFRRKREDVLSELPDKIEVKEWCEMTEKEEYLYEEAILDKRYTDIRRVSWNLDDLAESSKARRLKEIVEQAEDDGRKVLIFSFFRETVSKVSQLLDRRCVGIITGDVSPEKRQRIIDDFENAEAGTIIVAQIEAGGVGLNIQAASVVIICEPQLKPSIENQAISRVYRMGQARKVSVHRLLSVGSIDEKITKMLESKQNEFDAYADKSEAATVLKEDERLVSLVLEETARIIEKRASLTLNRDDGNSKKEDTSTTTQPKTSNDVTPKNQTSTINEYDKLITLKYEDIISHLLNKYGNVQGNFYDENDLTKENANISRKNEGLFCHHISEIEDTLIGEKTYADKFPSTMHESKNLVYCNIIEHLILHIKIAEELSNAEMPKPKASYICSSIINILRYINCIFNQQSFSLDVKVNTDEIKNSLDSYVKLLSHLWNIVKNNELYSKIIDKSSLATDKKGRIVKKIYSLIQ